MNHNSSESTDSSTTVTYSNGNFDQARIIISIDSGDRYVRNGTRISKPQATPENIDPSALATLLYAGTVIPPSTIYRDFASVGMGGTLKIRDRTDISFKEEPDLFTGASERSKASDSFDAIDELAVVLESSSINFDDCTLLLSEGKDSTGIALALAELGKKVNCFSFANADSNVTYIEGLAKRLGHKLTVFRYSDLMVSEDTIDRLANVFEPTVDQAFLSYLLLPSDQLSGRILIDGMGNDIYMGHLPTKDQYRATLVSHLVRSMLPTAIADYLRDIRSGDATGAGVPFRTFSECQGFYNGFSKTLVERSVGGKARGLTDLDSAWRELGFEKARALSRGRYLDLYAYCGKSIALAEMNDGKVYFPWADERLAEPYMEMSDATKFEWPSVNKLRLREAINRRFEYEQPKVGFQAPTTEIIATNRRLVDKVIGASRTLGSPMKDQLQRMSHGSQRLTVGFLYALWEFANSN